jgi:hypothetical protein
VTVATPPAFLRKFSPKEHSTGWAIPCPDRHSASGFSVIARADETAGRWRFECVDAANGDLCGNERELVQLLGLTNTEIRLEKAGARRVRLTRIADVAAKRVEWLEPGLIALGMLTGLVAPGGTIKGLYGIHQAAKLGQRGEKTLFVCSEDALDYIIRPRFQAAGCDAELAYALSVDDDAGEQVPHFPADLPLPPRRSRTSRRDW